MADFYSSWVSGWTAPNSYSKVEVTPFNCDMATTLIHFEPIASGSVAIFLASDSENFGIQAAGEAENTAYGQHATRTDIIFQIQNAGSNQNVTSETNGGPLLNLANQYKDLYFDGQTQTAASLKAYLDAKYGEHKYYYQGIALIANVIPFGDVQVEYPAHVYTSVEYTWPNYGTPSYDPSQAVAPTVDFTGVSLSWPSDLPPASQEPSTFPAFSAWWVFEEQENRNELRFDVYVNGTKDPNVAIRWSAVSHDDNFVLAYVNPIVWTYPEDQIIPYHDDGGINVPNESLPTIRKYANTWAGSYTKPYLTEFETDAESLTQVQRVTKYGLDGIANRMDYLLRFSKRDYANNQEIMTWGDLYLVSVPREVNSVGDIYVSQVANSQYAPQFATSVVVHLGIPEDEIPDDSEDYPQGTDPTGQDPGVYNPDRTPHDFDDGTPIGFNGKAILTRTYSMDAAVLQNIGSKLWSQSYFNVLKIQSNPIENIVSCKWFPFSRTGAQTDVKVGDVNFEITAGKIDSIYSFTVGSVTYRGKYTTGGKLCYLDGSPYTLLLLHLPWCGVVELDASLMINRTITVKYVVDLITGDCVAFVILDSGSVNYPYMSVSGHVGVDIPLTSTDRIQSEIRAASTTFSAVGSAAAGVATGNYLGAAEAVAGGAASVAGMDVTSQRSSAHSNACMSYENKNVFLEVWRPLVDPDLMKEGFKARHGWPCHKYMKLSSFSGFTKCSKNCKIDFAMTSEENKMIENLLTEGIYI